MNNKGFTLVELLGSMVILGLIMLIVVPNVVGLMNSNRETVYVEDAKKMILIAKAKVSGKKVKAPMGSNQCTFIGLGFLDNSEFDNPPNGGCYDVNRSFVIIKNEGHQLKYYVKLVEVFDNKYNGILTPVLSTELDKDKVEQGKTSDALRYNYGSNGADGYVTADKCSGFDDRIYTKNGPKTYKTDAEGICAKTS